MKVKLKEFFGRFDAINGWKNGCGAKQGDKYVIEFRLGKLTVIQIRLDLNKEVRLTLFNFAISFK